jgi:hypothetical protein
MNKSGDERRWTIGLLSWHRLSEFASLAGRLRSLQIAQSLAFSVAIRAHPWFVCFLRPGWDRRGRKEKKPRMDTDKRKTTAIAPYGPV